MAELSPTTSVYVVEPEGYDDHVTSLDRGEITPLTDSPPSLCDSLQVLAASAAGLWAECAVPIDSEPRARRRGGRPRQGLSHSHLAPRVARALSLSLSLSVSLALALALSLRLIGGGARLPHLPDQPAAAGRWDGGERRAGAPRHELTP
jgi:hypothetical protein